jgi:hypothetical protein
MFFSYNYISKTSFQLSKYRLNALNIGKSVHAKKTPDEVLLDTVHEVLKANDHPMPLVTERTEIEFIDD